MMDSYFLYENAALRLNDYIRHQHWRDSALTGPDPGLRYNFRIWRFLKSYLRLLPWKDDTYFLQCQGYWIWNNWKLHELYGDSRYSRTAAACTDRVLREQLPAGGWKYPLREWQDRVATVDGDYAARGLILTYEHTREKRYIAAAERWYDFLIREGGFQTYKDSLVIRYFAGRDGRLVPNNVTLTLTMNAELWAAARDDRFLEYNDKMIRFLEYALRPSGEFPYAFETADLPGREHFLCYQYNCFQFLDLARFWELTGDERVHALLERQIQFIKTGQCADGHSKYSCGKSSPDVSYYTAVMAAAFLKAAQIGLGNFEDAYTRAYACLLGKQDKNGGFPYSQKNYRLLQDKRSYPRYLAMILKHLLMIVQHEKGLSRNDSA